MKFYNFMLHVTHCSGVKLQPPTCCHSRGTFLYYCSFKNNNKKQQAFSINLVKYPCCFTFAVRVIILIIWSKSVVAPLRSSSLSCLLSYQQRPIGRKPEGFVGKGAGGQEWEKFRRSMLEHQRRAPDRAWQCP